MDVRVRVVTAKDLTDIFRKGRTAVDNRLAAFKVPQLNPGRRPAIFDLDSEAMKEAMRSLDAVYDAAGRIVVPDHFVPTHPWDEDYDFDSPLVARTEKAKITHGWALNRADLELAKIREQVANLELSNQKKRKELIERKVVQKILSELFAIDTIELGTLADTIGDELLALYDQGGRPDLRAIKDVVNSGVTRTVEHINRRIMEFSRDALEAVPESEAPEPEAPEPEAPEPEAPEPEAPEPEPEPEEPKPKRKSKRFLPDPNEPPSLGTDGKLNPDWVIWANSRR